MDNIWYFFCFDTCKKNKEKQEELIKEVNTNLTNIDSQSRVSCLSYNDKIFMHYDYNYSDIEYLNCDSLVFRNESMSIYDLFGDIFLKIIENKKEYKKIICNIYAFKLNVREKVYTKTVIQNLFNIINSKTKLIININILNQECLCIENIFNLEYTEPIDDKATSSNNRFSSKNKRETIGGSGSSENRESSGRKNIYFNIHIRN